MTKGAKTSLRGNGLQGQALQGGLAHAGAVVNVAAAWLLLATLVAVGWFGIVRPWQTFVDELRQEAVLKARRLGRLKAVLHRAQGGALAQLEELSRRAAADLLASGDPSLILADMQGQIGKLIATHGGTMMEVRPLPPKAEKDAIRLGLAVRFRAPVEKAFGILHAVETGVPLLFIDKATVRLFGDAQNRLLVAGKIGAQLLVEANIHGYQPGGEAPK